MTEKNLFEQKMSRREFLKKAGIGGAGLALGVSATSAFFSKKSEEEVSNLGKETVSFYGKHQSGIATPAQSNVYFMVLDLATTDKKKVIQLFKDWTDYSAKLMEGKVVNEEKSNLALPPQDTGEVLGLNPYRLSLTFGVAPSFLDKLGLSHQKMLEFQDLPKFPRDQIKDKYSGGDIVIQACADDAQVAFHAVHNLVRKGRSLVTMKWSQSGFLPVGDGKETPRNLFGFKDGTVNPRSQMDYEEVVWYKEKNWLQHGTFLVVRRIAMFLETWDRTALKEQENTFGRHRESGAPLGMKHEFDEMDLNKRDENGELVIPVDSHVRLAKEAKKQMLRRGYSYASGVDEVTGQFDTGLLFICFQQSPEQFIAIQNMLGNQDKLNEYITHVGSGLFAIFPGVKKGEYLGQALLEG